jgi:hypothetical protein
MVVLFWAWTLMYAPQVAAGGFTPWLGVIERIALAAWLLWLAVLAVDLLRGNPRRSTTTPLGRIRHELCSLSSRTTASLKR